METRELVTLLDDAVLKSLPSALVDRVQGGVSDAGGAQFIVCMAVRDLRAEYGWLPQAAEQDEGLGDIECADLMIDFDTKGRLVRADFESYSLRDTFALLGDEVAAKNMANLIGKKAEQACVGLSVLLPTLFEAPVGQP